MAARRTLVPLSLPADPVNPLEAATKQYADSKIARSGDAMSGVLQTNNQVQFTASGVNNASQGIGWTGYSPAPWLSYWNGDLGVRRGDTIAPMPLVVADPTTATHAATKSYVDGKAGGLVLPGSPTFGGAPMYGIPGTAGGSSTTMATTANGFWYCPLNLLSIINITGYYYRLSATSTGKMIVGYIQTDKNWATTLPFIQIGPELLLSGVAANVWTKVTVSPSVAIPAGPGFWVMNTDSAVTLQGITNFGPIGMSAGYFSMSATSFYTTYIGTRTYAATFPGTVPTLAAASGVGYPFHFIYTT